MTNDKWFQEKEETYFSQRFQYEVKYTVCMPCGIKYIKIGKQYPVSEGTENPKPVQVVSEAIYHIVRENEPIVVSLYGRLIGFEQRDSLEEIEKRIVEIQKAIVRIDTAEPEVRKYFDKCVEGIIKDMPVR